MPNLLINDPAKGNRCYELLEDVVTIGRLPDNTIQIENASVSSYHAKLILRDGRYFLKDLGSTNRSWVDGVPVTESEIKQSCGVRFGGVECRLVLENGSDPVDKRGTVPVESAREPSPAAEGAESKTTSQNAGKNGDHEKQLVSLTRQRDALLQTNHSLNVMLAEVQKKVETRRPDQEPSNGSEATSGQNSDLLTIKRQRDALQQVADQLAPKLAQAEKKLMFVSAEREATLRANQELSSRLAEAQRQFESLTATRETYHTQYQDLVNTLNEKKAQIISLQEERDTAIQKCDELEQDVDKAHAEIRSLTKECDGLRTELDGILEEQESADDSGEEESEEQEEEEDYVEPPVRKKRIPPKAAHKRRSETPRARESVPEKPPEQVKRPEKHVVPTPQPAPVQQEPATAKWSELKLKPIDLKPAASDEALRNQGREISKLLKKLHTAHNYFARHQKESHLLQQICEQVESLRESTALTQLRPANDLIRALAEWLFELDENRQQLDSSALRTSTQAIEVLDSVFEEDRCMRLKHLWSPKALVVDDDPDILDTVNGALAHAKLNTFKATDARGGLEKLYEGKFDIIILDVGLPEVNGLDLCAEIRSMPNNTATPILFLTGADTPQTRAQTAITGGKDFIAKPFRIGELALRTLTWVLKGQMQIT